MPRLQGVVSWVPRYANRYNFSIKVRAFSGLKKKFVRMAVFTEVKVRRVPSGGEL